MYRIIFNLLILLIVVVANALPFSEVDATSEYVIVAVTSTGTWTVPSGIYSVDVLVVAGGGGGGSVCTGGETFSAISGGGGGGGLIYRPSFAVTPGDSIAVTVGNGGVADSAGQDSVFSTLTAKGGGYGSPSLYNGGNGGSGGGGGMESHYGGGSASSGGTATQPSQPGDSGLYGYGYNGGNGGVYPAGGGGGAGSAGGTGYAGSGKNMSTVFGTTYGVSGVFAAGGYSNTPVSNSGNGGSTCGGNGSSGIVLIRYRYDITVTTNAATFLTGTTATANGIITFTDRTRQLVGIMYGTVSNSTTPSPGVVPPDGYTSNITVGGSYGNVSFSVPISGLAIGTKYYFRAYAGNTTYYGYGDELYFTTINVPSVILSSATYVSTTTARLNSSLSNDGGELCDVRFGYGTTSQTATLAGFNAYTTKTAWVNNTYATSSSPFVDLTGLSPATVYYYNVQVQNSAGIAYGVEGTFSTSSGMGDITNFVAMPSYNNVTLSWSKGSGSSNTVIRYSLSGYPATVADGTLLYSGIYSSTIHSGLTPGTTVYYSAWGMTAGVYTTTHATTLATTTAGVIITPITTPTPTTNKFVSMPSGTALSNFPLYDIGNWAAGTYSLPQGTYWAGYYLLFVLIVGMIIYIKATANNLFLTLFAMAILLIAASIPTPPVLPLWVGFSFCILSIAVGLTMNRQP